MQRNPNASSRIPANTTSENPPSKPTVLQRSTPDHAGNFWDMLGFRLFFALLCTVVGYHFRPFSVTREYGALGGLLFAVAVILFEVRLRKASLRRLIGAVTGSIVGILGAYLTSLILTHTTMPESTRSFFSLCIFLVMTYLG